MTFMYPESVFKAKDYKDPIKIIPNTQNVADLDAERELIWSGYLRQNKVNDETNDFFDGKTKDTFIDF